MARVPSTVAGSARANASDLTRCATDCRGRESGRFSSLERARSSTSSRSAWRSRLTRPPRFFRAAEDQRHERQRAVRDLGASAATPRQTGLLPCTPTPHGGRHPSAAGSCSARAADQLAHLAPPDLSASRTPAAGRPRIRGRLGARRNKGDVFDGHVGEMSSLVPNEARSASVVSMRPSSWELISLLHQPDSFPAHGPVALLRLSCCRSMGPAVSPCGTVASVVCDWGDS